jgi:mono/diheme cytochrome c family protein
MIYANRHIYLFAIGMILFLSVFERPAPVLAADCNQTRKKAQAPGNIYKQTNPLVASSENLLAGKLLYSKGAKPLACILCHGISGAGNGKMARGMTPAPRDFSCQSMMKDIPDGQLFWVIRNGSKGTGMMGFKALSEEQVWQIVFYVRQFSN